MKIERIIFAGTPEFAVPTLKKLLENNYKPLLSISQPDKPKGRRKKLSPTPVKIFSQENNIPVFQPENINSPQAIEKILSFDPQIIITVAYGGFIGKKLRNTPLFGAINLHPSLLPKYRGAAPVNFALFNGEEYTGITVFKLIAKMDAGPILLQRKIKINKTDCYTCLSEKLAELGAHDVIKTLNLMENNLINPIRQDDAKATYTRKIEKEDLSLDLNHEAKKIINIIRGLALKPGAHLNFRDNKLKILEAEQTTEKSLAPPYTITSIIKNKGIKVATKDYDIIITKVQPAGKKIMNAFAFNLGARLKAGNKLE